MSKNVKLVKNGERLARAIAFLDAVVRHMNDAPLELLSIPSDHPDVRASEAALHEKLGGASEQFLRDLPHLLAFIKIFVPLARKMAEGYNALAGVEGMNT